MDEFEKELKLDFLQEATGLLESTEQAFLKLESELDNPVLIDEIFRFAHNLKGTSRAVGFGGVAEFTHELENVILKLKQKELEVTPSIVTVLLECNDHIAHMIETLKGDFEAQFEHQSLISTLRSIIDGSFVGEASEASSVPDASAFEEEVVETVPEAIQEETPVEELDLEALERMALEQFQGLQASNLSFQEGNEPLKMKEDKAEIIPIKKQEPVVQPKPQAPVQAKEEESIRVSLSRLEKLNDFVGELVILQTVLSQQISKTLNDTSLKSVSQLGKISKEIQDIAMSLRMVPVKATMQKMTRIVRDTSKALGKKVDLELVGEETEIDKTVLEHLADPLVHIVRNAVDHGLELPEDRIKIGKNEAGKVVIKSYHEGNNLVIEVRDDGKGIDANIIRRKAIEKGVITPATQMSDSEVIQLIFHPGFSTKDVVSEVSGRGVGMDVVKTNIEKMSGQVRVDTKVGEGSVFKIVLPLTMAIIEAMVAEVSKERFIIPLAQIHESIKPKESEVDYVTGFGATLSLRGEVIPFLRVSDMLGFPKNTKPLTDDIAIIVKGKNGTFAVAVDDISHQQQVVIKKLGKEIKEQQGFMGSSILGDGKPSFILDLEELAQTKIKNHQHKGPSRVAA